MVTDEGGAAPAVDAVALGALAALDELVALATTARLAAYAPYSRFRVGAAVRGTSGRVYTGCNVESASYSLTCCAERVAVFKAVSEGERGIVACAVVTDVQPPVGPCGACRQVLLEFGPDAPIVWANLAGERCESTMRALLPGAFDASQLPGAPAAGTPPAGTPAAGTLAAGSRA